MAVQIQWRRDTAATWTSENPTLAQGEIGLETDTDRVKIGDGLTAWTSLGYAFETGGGGGGGGHIIREAGSPMTARGYLNFLAGFDLTDDSGSDETEIALDASEVSGAPVSTDIGDSQTTGASASFSNANHQHASPAPSAGYPVDAVIGTEADGVATTPARSDHQHSITAPSAGYPVDVAAAEGDGTSAQPARADHVHAHGTGYLPDAHHARAHDHSNASDTTALVPESVEITGGPFAVRGDISPAQLTANTNDWAPTGLADAVVIRFSTDASRNITGLTGGADGRVILLANVGSNDAVLKHDVTSTAANRFYNPGSVDATLAANACAWLVYDSTVSRWRVVGILALGTNTPNPVGTAAAGTNALASHQDHVHATGASTPTTQAFGDAAATGSGPAAAMTDHKHAMPANPVTGHEAAADPHPGYVLESLFDAKGDVITASADNTPTKTTVGANDTIFMADSAAGGGVKWVGSQTPSTQAFGDAAAEGTADTYSRGDHKHAMPATPVTSIAKSGSGALTGAVTLSQGANVTLTQVGNDISVAASAGGGSGDNKHYNWLMFR